MSTVDNGRGPDPGGIIGSRLVNLVARGLVVTKGELAPHTAAIARTVFTDVTNHVSDEVRGAMGPLWRAIARDDTLSPPVRQLLNNLGTQRGQAWAWIGGTATGAALGGGLLNLITNEMNGFILPAIAANPNGILAPGDVAAAAARGVSVGLPWRAEAARSGLNSDRFNALVDVATQHVSPIQVLELRNRNLITDGHARSILRALAFDINEHDPFLALRRVLLSPERLAELVNFGVISEDDARPVAVQNGLSAEDFHRLVLGAGQPPGIQEVLLAWRRGIIGESDVDRALRQSPIRFEWLPVIKSLQWNPLPLSEAADAVNQGHLTKEQAYRVARENGVRDNDFDVFVANAGIPPGPQTVLDWTNRGLVSEQEALGMLYESRIKNKHVPTYLKSRYETMPPETVRLMYARGVISREDAIRRLTWRGYSPADAAIIVNGAIAERSQSTKDLTRAQIVDMYELRMITRDDAAASLVDLGYEPSEAEALLILAELARVRRFQSAAITRVRAAYLAGRIDENNAYTTLDRLGATPDQRDDLVSLWTIERTTYSRALTPAQLVSAAKKGIIGYPAAHSRLVGQGYSPEDARILLAISNVLPDNGAEGV